jgi:hypothetical protein
MGIFADDEIAINSMVNILAAKLDGNWVIGGQLPLLLLVPPRETAKLIMPVHSR